MGKNIKYWVDHYRVPGHDRNYPERKPRLLVFIDHEHKFLAKQSHNAHTTRNIDKAQRFYPAEAEQIKASLDPIKVTILKEES